MLKSLQEILHGDAEHALRHLWSDQLTIAEGAAIQNRVWRDPKYRDEYQGLLAVVASMQGLEEDRAIEEILRDYRPMLQKHRARKRLALGMFAGMLLAVGAYLAVFTPWRGPDDSHLHAYFTGIGEQQTIELDDGSVVTLNTAGQMLVDYSGHARRIVLERGEAYFEVAADPERPFTVDLGARSVTAMGTAFNIRKTPERYQVAVIEGAIALHASAEDVFPVPLPISADGPTMVLNPHAEHRVEEGWLAEFDVNQNRLTAFQPESIDRYQEWRSGVLSFYPAPLLQVVQELNRYTRKKILIEDATLLELEVYTVLDIREIDSALQGLEQLLPIRVTRYYDRIVITGSAGD